MLTLFESRYTLKGRYNIGNVGKTASMSMLTLFESRYTLKGRYNIGNVGKTASMNMLTLFESRYTLKGRYNIGNVGKTASMTVCLLSLNQDIHWREGTTLVMLAKLLLWVGPMLTLFESRYTLKGRYNIGNVGKTASIWVCLLSLNQDIHWREGTTLVMLAKLLLWVCLLSLNQDIHWREGTTLVMLAKLLLYRSMLTLYESRYTLKGRYNIGNIENTASMSMLTFFESRYTLKGRYNIGNVGKTASIWVCLLSMSQDRLHKNTNLWKVQFITLCRPREIVKMYSAFLYKLMLNLGKSRKGFSLISKFTLRIISLFLNMTEG